jgi:hypothetical protein
LDKLRDERIDMLVYEIERVANDPSLGGKDSKLVNALIEDHLKLCQERGDEIAFAGFIDLSGARKAARRRRNRRNK